MDDLDHLGLTFGTRLWRAFRNILLLTIFLGLLGAAGYALSVMNSRTWTLEVHDGLLVVLKGRLFPFGAEPWIPADPHLADAYAPVDLAGSTSLVAPGKRFEDRDELDRALFDVLEELAKPRLSSESRQDVDRGLRYVRRAEVLTGLSTDQRQRLKKMQQDLAFFLAQARLDEARQKLEDALEQLKLAAASDSRHHTDASVMLLAVEPQVKLLATTLRATSVGRSAEGGKGLDLTDALAPQIKEVFEALQKKPTDETKASPPPAKGPEDGPRP